MSHHITLSLCMNMYIQENSLKKLPNPAQKIPKKNSRKYLETPEYIFGRFAFSGEFPKSP